MRKLPFVQVDVFTDRPFAGNPLAVFPQAEDLTAVQMQAIASAPSDDLDAKMRAMERLQQYRIDVEGIMADLAGLLPDSTLISSVQFSRERRLVLKGTSKDAKAAFTLADVLRQKPARFANVSPERAAPGQGGEFTVTADVVGIQSLTAGTPSGRTSTWR